MCFPSFGHQQAYKVEGNYALANQKNMPSALKFVKLQQIISIPYNSCNNGLKGHIIGEKDASKMFCNWNKKKNKVKGKKKKKVHYCITLREFE